MAQYCIQCGAALKNGAHFCAECGAPADSEAMEAGKADDAPRGRPKWLVIGGAAFVVILLLLYYLLFLRDDLGGRGLEDRVGAAPPPVEQEILQRLYSTADANIRDRASTQGSAILGKLPRGSAASGRVILGEDGTSQWLELEGGKGFVALANLSEYEPPLIEKQLGDKVWNADRAIEIWAQPATASTLLDRVGPGTPLTLSGLVAGDFIEVKLKAGGVGYIADGKRIAALANGKPIAIAFNPNSCSFGSEIDTMLEAIGKRMQAQYRAIENRDYPDEAAREKALGAIDGKSAFQKLQRSFEGLTVTAIAQHYESQSVYFAESPAQVIATFRAKGFSIDRNGAFKSQDLYAGIGKSAGEGARYGQADLSCGV